MRPLRPPPLSWSVPTILHSSLPNVVPPFENAAKAVGQQANADATKALQDIAVKLYPSS